MDPQGVRVLQACVARTGVAGVGGVVRGARFVPYAPLVVWRARRGACALVGAPLGEGQHTTAIVVRAAPERRPRGWSVCVAVGPVGVRRDSRPMGATCAGSAQDEVEDKKDHREKKAPPRQRGAGAACSALGRLGGHRRPPHAIVSRTGRPLGRPIDRPIARPIAQPMARRASVRRAPSRELRPEQLHSTSSRSAAATAGSQVGMRGAASRRSLSL